MGRNYAQEESEQIQQRLVALVRQNGRMSFVRLRKMTGLAIFTMCHQLEKAAERGEVYLAGKHGIFPSMADFLKWRNSRKPVQSRRAQEAMEVVVGRYDRENNVICQECRNSPSMRRVLAFYRSDYRELLRPEKETIKGSYDA